MVNVNDIKSGLLKKRVQEKAFWGHYENLEKQISSENVDNSVLLSMQVSALAKMESQEDYSITNDFLNQASMKKANDTFNAIEEKSVSQLYGRLIELLNAGLWSSEMNPIRISKEMYGEGIEYQKERDKRVGQIINEATQILSQLKISEPVAKQTIDTLQQRISKMGNSTEQYVAQKANLAEVLGVELFMQNPNFKAYQTGNVMDRLGQQLIEDAMAFSKDALSQKFAGGLLTYHIKVAGGNGWTTKQASSLEDYFNQLEQINGEYQIKLGDELYDAMQKAAIISAQMKSGQDQPILNKAARNSITLEEIGFSSHDLWNVYFEDLNKDNVATWFKTTDKQYSNTLNTVLNYLLSKSIASTNISKNKLYFSKSGITTASQWMEINQYILRFNPTINKMYMRMNQDPKTYYFKKLAS